MKFLIKFFLIILLMFGSVVYYSPYYVLSRMQANAMNGYDKGLLRYINQPKLQANATDSLIKGWVEKASKKNERIIMFNANATEPIIVLTAREIAKAIIKPKNMASLIISGEFPSTPPPDEELGSSDPTAKPESLSEAFVNGHYESINVFLVTIKKKEMGGKPFDLVLTRKGLFSWELTNIRVNVESIWPI